VETRTGFVWLMTGPVGGVFWMRYWTFWFHKICGFS